MKEQNQGPRSRIQNKAADTFRNKADLFINMAHENRTPLTLIRNYLDRYISRHGEDEDLRIIKQNINRLLRDNINYLDSEKLSQGEKLYEHKKIFDLTSLLKKKIKLFKPLGREKGIKLILTAPGNHYLKADPRAIDRIVSNLVDNAFQYTCGGGEIRIILKKEKDCLQLQVKDTGTGISQEQQEHLFQPYYQITHTKQNTQGLGMGLQISKMILDTLEGSIQVKSIPGKGSCFTVTLKEYIPRQEDHITGDLELSKPMDRVSRVLPEERQKKEYKKNILVVDDNKELVRYIQECLTDRYNVYYAFNGQTALDKLEKIPPPDLILSDIMMDTMDGYEFYRELKQKDEYKETPFIFLTAKSGKENHLKGLGDGALDYIDKPFSMDLLNAKIDAITMNHSLKKRAYEKKKFADLGMLFSGISHEILNPLGSIYAPLENLEKKMEDLKIEKNLFQDYFSRIFTNLERIEKLVKSLKVLYYNKPLTIQSVNLNAIAREARESLKMKWPPGIRLCQEIDKEVEIIGNTAAFSHIIRNLFSNALDAMEEKGIISIITEKEAGTTLIRIKDTGKGIPRERREDIFKPFFTGKEVGQGTGLGLYIVNDLVIKMGWEIDFNSSPEKGTEFILFKKNGLV